MLTSLTKLCSALSSFSKMSSIDVMLDRSKKKLHEVPTDILSMGNLKMLYLEGNYISTLPEDFFQKLPNLVWFDIRNNKLKGIPKSIAFHNRLETLLVQGNDIDVLPVELCKYFLFTTKISVVHSGGTHTLSYGQILPVST